MIGDLLGFTDYRYRLVDSSRLIEHAAGKRRREKYRQPLQ